MSVLIIAGLVVVAIGVVVFIWPTKQTDQTRQAVAGVESIDVGKVLEEVNKLLDKLDKRYRPGMVLMLVGLTLVALGVYLEAKDAKDAAETAAILLPLT